MKMIRKSYKNFILNFNLKSKIQNPKLIPITIILSLLLLVLPGCGQKEDKLETLIAEIKFLKSQVIDLKERVEFLEKKLRVEEERKFDQEQIAKGLVKYQDRWMTENEKRKLVEEEHIRHDKYKNIPNQPVSKGKGLVWYNDRWVTPQERLEMEKIKKEEENN